MFHTGYIFLAIAVTRFTLYP